MNNKNKNEILNDHMLSEVDYTENIPVGKSFVYFNKYEKELDKVRNLPIFFRIFRGMKSGSLRNGILSWLGVTLGSGVLNFPKIFRNLGFLNAIIFLVWSSYVSSVCMSLLIKVSFYSKKKNLIILIESYYGKRVAKIWLLIIIFMISVMVIIYIVISYNFFWTFLSYFFKDYFADVRDPKNTYKMKSFLWRFIFVCINYAVMFPVIIQKNYDKLKPFSILFMGSLFYIVLVVIIESPFFTYHYSKNVFYSDKNQYDWFFSTYYKDWVKSISTILLSFYVQTSMFNILGLIKNPTIKRCRKIKNSSILIEFMLYLLLGISGYLSLGKDKEVKLIIQRDNFTNSYYDIFMKIGVFVYLFANMVAAAFYSPPLTTYLNIFFNLKEHSFKSKVTVLINFVFCSVVALVYPNVESLFQFAGGVIGNFIGFILPILIFYKTPEAVKTIPKYKHVRNFVILFYLWSLPLLQIIWGFIY